MVDKEMPIVSCSEMKEIERKAAEGGLSYYQMMVNAGTAATEFIITQESVQRKRVVVFCGKGNNGGDGFVVARRLYEHGAEIKIVLVDGEPKTEDAIKNKQICEAFNILTLDITEQDLRVTVSEADIIVDAIYGTGFHGELKDEVRNATILINHSNATVYSLDIPSGLEGDNGDADSDTVYADYTIAFHRYKPAHLMDAVKKYCGQSVCVEIGIM